MRKRFFQRNFFLKCLMVLLAIGWSTSSVQADTYYFRLRVVAICDGSRAKSWVSVGGSSAPTPESSEYTMSVASFTTSPSVYFKG